MAKICKGFTLLLTLIIVMSSLTLFDWIPLGLAQSGTSVNGIISTDTTWTKSGSPYLLTGPVAINRGTTLTIEAGVNVELNGYNIQVNGTLRAIGSIANKIHLNDGKIIFKHESVSWSEETKSGSIIENAELSSSSSAIAIWQVSPKIINNNIIGSIDIYGSSPITNQLAEASPIISNNVITKPGSTAIASSGLPSIVSNKIKGDINSGGRGITIIANNIIEEGGIGAGSDYIIGNTLLGGDGTGIRAGTGTIIKNNIIKNYQDGILLWINSNPLIQNNTITNNVNGISVPGYNEGSKINYYNIQVNYNNIYDNSKYNVNLYMSTAYPKNDINATYNWWGTIDQTTIGNSIYDSKNDFNLGTVTFTPFLTAPNSQATPNQNTPIPTSSPLTSQTPSPTPTVPELSWLAIIPLMVSILFIVITVRHRKTAN
jgi:parallel beta-helix repeat protein